MCFKIYKIIKHILIRIYCFIIFLFIFILKKKKQNVYICSRGLGDTCYALSFNSHILKNGDCKFYISEGHKLLIEKCYPDLYKKAEIVFYKKKQLLFYAIKCSVFSTWHNHIFSKLGINIIFPFAWLDTHLNIQYDYFSVIKKFILPFIHTNTSIEYPNVPKVIVNCIEDFQQNKKRIVIINPYSNSMQNEGEELWENIVDDLISDGYLVYTNVMKNQKEIKNTRRLDCSIIELYNICNEIPLFISIRSGIIDFTISSKCKKIVIWYCSKNSSFSNLCKLEAWNIKNVYSIYHTNNNETFLEYRKYLAL